MDISELSQEDLQKIKATLDTLDDRIMDVEGAIQRLYTAFPGSDVEGHRRFHDREIRKFEQREKLIAAIQEKTISGLIWAAIVGASLMAWHSFMNLIGKV